MRERLLERGKTSGRADDNESTIVKRFNTFVEQSKPVVDKYAAMGKVLDISAMRSPDDVFVDVKAALDFRLRGIPMAEAAAVATTSKTESALPADSKIIFVLGGPGSGKVCSTVPVHKLQLMCRLFHPKKNSFIVYNHIFRHRVRSRKRTASRFEDHLCSRGSQMWQGVQRSASA